MALPNWLSALDTFSDDEERRRREAELNGSLLQTQPNVASVPQPVIPQPIAPTPPPVPEPTPAPLPAQQPFDQQAKDSQENWLDIRQQAGESVPERQPLTPTPVSTDQSGGISPGVQGWDNLVAAASKKHDVPESVIKAVMDIESKGDPGAISPAGALSLMQVMPFNAQDGEDLSDPATNINRGTALLADRFARYGSWDKAVASYFGALDANGNITDASDATGATGTQYVEKFLAAQAAYEQAPSAETEDAPRQQNPWSLDGLTPAQLQTAREAGLDENTALAVCGPIAALAFAARMGRYPSLTEALDLAKSVGWTVENGMAGPGSQQKLLEKLGIASALEWGKPDWGKVAADVQGGNPVIISTAGHYFVAEGYDPSTGRFDFGNSARVLIAAGGQSWFTPAQMEALGRGDARAALYMDNPGTPSPSVVAGRSVDAGTQPIPQRLAETDDPLLTRVMRSIERMNKSILSDQTQPKAPDVAPTPPTAPTSSLVPDPLTIGKYAGQGLDILNPLTDAKKEYDAHGINSFSDAVKLGFMAVSGMANKSNAALAIAGAANDAVIKPIITHTVNKLAESMGIDTEPLVPIEERRGPLESVIDPDLSTGEALANTQTRGWTNAYVATLTGVASAVRETGLVPLANAIDKLADQGQEYLYDHPEAMRRSTGDVFDGPFGVVEGVTESLPSLLPTILSSVLAIVGARTGNMGLIGAAGKISQAGLYLGSLQSYGGTVRDLRGDVRAGRMTQATANSIALGAGLTEYATEQIFPSIDKHLASKIAKDGAEHMVANLTEKGLIHEALHIGKEIGVEMLQEGTEEIISESYGLATDYAFQENKPTLMEAARRLGSAFAIGGLSVGPIAGPTTIINRLGERRSEAAQRDVHAAANDFIDATGSIFPDQGQQPAQFANRRELERALYQAPPERVSEIEHQLSALPTAELAKLAPRAVAEAATPGQAKLDRPSEQLVARILQQRGGDIFQDLYGGTHGESTPGADSHAVRTPDGNATGADRGAGSPRDRVTPESGAQSGSGLGTSLADGTGSLSGGEQAGTLNDNARSSVDFPRGQSTHGRFDATNTDASLSLTDRETGTTLVIPHQGGVNVPHIAQSVSRILGIPVDTTGARTPFDVYQRSLQAIGRAYQAAQDAAERGDPRAAQMQRRVTSMDQAADVIRSAINRVALPERFEPVAYDGVTATRGADPGDMMVDSVTQADIDRLADRRRIPPLQLIASVIRTEGASRPRGLPHEGIMPSRAKLGHRDQAQRIRAGYQRAVQSAWFKTWSNASLNAVASANTAVIHAIDRAFPQSALNAIPTAFGGTTDETHVRGVNWNNNGRDDNAITLNPRSFFYDAVLSARQAGIPIRQADGSVNTEFVELFIGHVLGTIAHEIAHSYDLVHLQSNERLSGKGHGLDHDVLTGLAIDAMERIAPSLERLYRPMFEGQSFSELLQYFDETDLTSPAQTAQPRATSSAAPGLTLDTLLDAKPSEIQRLLAAASDADVLSMTSEATRQFSETRQPEYRQIGQLARDEMRSRSGRRGAQNDAVDDVTPEPETPEGPLNPKGNNPNAWPRHDAEIRGPSPDKQITPQDYGQIQSNKKDNKPTGPGYSVHGVWYPSDVSHPALDNIDEIGDQSSINRVYNTSEFQRLIDYPWFDESMTSEEADQWRSDVDSILGSLVETLSKEDLSSLEFLLRDEVGRNDILSRLLLRIQGDRPLDGGNHPDAERGRQLKEYKTLSTYPSEDSISDDMKARGHFIIPPWDIIKDLPLADLHNLRAALVEDGRQDMAEYVSQAIGIHRLTDQGEESTNTQSPSEGNLTFDPPWQDGGNAGTQEDPIDLTMGDEHNQPGPKAEAELTYARTLADDFDKAREQMRTDRSVDGRISARDRLSLLATEVDTFGRELSDNDLNHILDTLESELPDHRDESGDLRSDGFNTVYSTLAQEHAARSSGERPAMPSQENLDPHTAEAPPLDRRVNPDDKRSLRGFSRNYEGPWQSGRLNDETDSPVSRAQSEVHHVGATVNKERLPRQMANNQYVGNIGLLLTRELVQNAVDAARATDGNVEVYIDPRSAQERHVSNGSPSLKPDPAIMLGDRFKEDEFPERSIAVIDQGVGMTRDLLETKFLEVGGTGKEGGSTASGGFGTAKLIYLGNSEQIAVRTVTMVNGKAVESLLYGSSEDYFKGNLTSVSGPVDSLQDHYRNIPAFMGLPWFVVRGHGGKGSTGTVVFVTPLKGHDLNAYKAEGWLHAMQNYGDASIGKRVTSIIAGKYGGIDINRGRSSEASKKLTDIPDRHIKSFDITAIDKNSGKTKTVARVTLKGSTLHPPEQSVMGAFIRTHTSNRGLVQSSDAIKVADGYLYPTISIDVAATVEPDEHGYPWKSDRTGLLKDAADQVDAAIGSYIAQLQDTQESKYQRIIRLARDIGGGLKLINPTSVDDTTVIDALAKGVVVRRLAAPFKALFDGIKRTLIDDEFWKTEGVTPHASELFGLSLSDEAVGENLKGEHIERAENLVTANLWSAVLKAARYARVFQREMVPASILPIDRQHALEAERVLRSILAAPRDKQAAMREARRAITSYTPSAVLALLERASRETEHYQKLQAMEWRTNPDTLSAYDALIQSWAAISEITADDAKQRPVAQVPGGFTTKADRARLTRFRQILTNELLSVALHEHIHDVSRGHGEEFAYYLSFAPSVVVGTDPHFAMMEVIRNLDDATLEQILTESLEWEKAFKGQKSVFNELEGNNAKLTAEHGSVDQTPDAQGAVADDALGRGAVGEPNDNRVGQEGAQESGGESRAGPGLGEESTRDEGHPSFSADTEGESTQPNEQPSVRDALRNIAEKNPRLRRASTPEGLSEAEGNLARDYNPGDPSASFNQAFATFGGSREREHDGLQTHGYEPITNEQRVGIYIEMNANLDAARNLPMDQAEDLGVFRPDDGSLAGQELTVVVPKESGPELRAAAKILANAEWIKTLATILNNSPRSFFSRSVAQALTDLKAIYEPNGGSVTIRPVKFGGFMIQDGMYAVNTPGRNGQPDTIALNPVMLLRAAIRSAGVTNTPAFDANGQVNPAFRDILIAHLNQLLSHEIAHSAVIETTSSESGAERTIKLRARTEEYDHKEAWAHVFDSVDRVMETQEDGLRIGDALNWIFPQDGRSLAEALQTYAIGTGVRHTNVHVTRRDQEVRQRRGGNRNGDVRGESGSTPGSRRSRTEAGGGRTESVQPAAGGLPGDTAARPSRERVSRAVDLPPTPTEGLGHHGAADRLTQEDGDGIVGAVIRNGTAAAQEASRSTPRSVTSGVELRGQADLEESRPELATTLDRIAAEPYLADLAPTVERLVKAAFEFAGRRFRLSTDLRPSFRGFLAGALGLEALSSKVFGSDVHVIDVNPYEVYDRYMRARATVLASVGDDAEIAAEIKRQYPAPGEDGFGAAFGRHLTRAIAHEVLHLWRPNNTHDTGTYGDGQESTLSRVTASVIESPDFVSQIVEPLNRLFDAPTANRFASDYRELRRLATDAETDVEPGPETGSLERRFVQMQSTQIKAASDALRELVDTHEESGETPSAEQLATLLDQLKIRGDTSGELNLLPSNLNAIVRSAATAIAETEAGRERPTKEQIARRYDTVRGLFVDWMREHGVTEDMVSPSSAVYIRGLGSGLERSGRNVAHDDAEGRAKLYSSVRVRVLALRSAIDALFGTHREDHRVKPEHWVRFTNPQRSSSGDISFTLDDQRLALERELVEMNKARAESDLEPWHMTASVEVNPQTGREQVVIRPMADPNLHQKLAPRIAEIMKLMSADLAGATTAEDRAEVQQRYFQQIHDELAGQTNAREISYEKLADAVVDRYVTQTRMRGTDQGKKVEQQIRWLLKGAEKVGPIVASSVPASQQQRPTKRAEGDLIASVGRYVLNTHANDRPEMRQVLAALQEIIGSRQFENVSQADLHDLAIVLVGDGAKNQAEFNQKFDALVNGIARMNTAEPAAIANLLKRAFTAQIVAAREAIADLKKKQEAGTATPHEVELAIKAIEDSLSASKLGLATRRYAEMAGRTLNVFRQASVLMSASDAYDRAKGLRADVEMARQAVETIRAYHSGDAQVSDSTAADASNFLAKFAQRLQKMAADGLINPEEWSVRTSPRNKIPANEATTDELVQAFLEGRITTPQTMRGWGQRRARLEALSGNDQLMTASLSAAAQTFVERLGEIEREHVASHNNTVEQLRLQTEREQLLDMISIELEDGFRDSFTRAQAAHAKLSAVELNAMVNSILGTADTEWIAREARIEALAGTPQLLVDRIVQRIRDQHRKLVSSEEARLNYWLKVAAQLEAAHGGNPQLAGWLSILEAEAEQQIYELGWHQSGGQAAAERVRERWMAQRYGKGRELVTNLFSAWYGKPINGKRPTAFENQQVNTDTFKNDLGKRITDALKDPSDPALRQLVKDHFAPLAGNRLADQIAVDTESLLELERLRQDALFWIKEVEANPFDSMTRSLAQSALLAVESKVKDPALPSWLTQRFAHQPYTLRVMADRAVERARLRMDREIARNEDKAFRDEIRPFLRRLIKDPEDPEAGEKTMEILDRIKQSGRAVMARRIEILLDARTAGATQAVIDYGTDPDAERDQQQQAALGMIKRLEELSRLRRNDRTGVTSRLITDVMNNLGTFGDIGVAMEQKAREQLIAAGLERIHARYAKDKVAQFGAFMGMVDPNDPASLGRALRYIQQPTWLQYYREYGIINMLSSPTTWGLGGTNVMSQIMQVALAAPNWAFEYAGDVIGATVNHRDRTVFASELGVLWDVLQKRETWSGLGDALSIMRTGHSRTELEDTVRSGDLREIRSELWAQHDNPAVRRLGVLGHMISTRPLAAVDAVFSTALYTAHIQMQAERKAKQLGGGITRQDILRDIVDHRDVLEKAGKIRDHVLLQSRSKALHTIIRWIGDQQNSDNPRQRTAGKVMELLWHTLIPFTTVPWNYTKQGVELSAVGATFNTLAWANDLRIGVGTLDRAIADEVATRQRKGEAVTEAMIRSRTTGETAQRARASAVEANERFAKAAMGWSLLATAAYLVGQGLLSGDEPDDPEERERRRSNGIKPRSILIGGVWYSYESTPFAIPWAMTATAIDRYNSHYIQARKRGEEDSVGTRLNAGITGAGSGVVSAIGTNIFLENLLDLTNVATGQSKSPGRDLANVAGSALIGRNIPASGLWNWLAKVADSYTGANGIDLSGRSGVERDARSDNWAVEMLNRQVTSRMPIARETLPAQRDLRGQPIPNETGILTGLLTPARMGHDRTSILASLLKEWDVPIDMEPQTISVSGGAPIQLTLQERRVLSQAYGPKLEDMVLQTVNQDFMNMGIVGGNTPPDIRRKLQHDTLTQVANVAREQAFIEAVFPSFGSNNDARILEYQRRASLLARAPYGDYRN